MKTYIASPFFNSIQSNQVSIIENILNNISCEYYSPRRHGNFSEMKISAEFNDLVKSLIFEDNIDRIKWSERVIVNLLGHRDLGTLFELGVAIALNKSIHLLITNDANDEIECELIDPNSTEIYYKILSNQSIRLTINYLKEINKNSLNKIKSVIVDTNEPNSYPAGIILLGYFYARSIKTSYISNFISKSNLMITQSGIKQYRSLTDFDNNKSVDYSNEKIQ